MSSIKRYKVEYEISCDEDENGEYCLYEDVKELERQNRLMQTALEFIITPTPGNFDDVYLLHENIKIAEETLKEV